MPKACLIKEGDNSESFATRLRVFFLIFYEMIVEVGSECGVRGKKLRSGQVTGAQEETLTVKRQSLRQQINKCLAVKIN